MNKEEIQKLYTEIKAAKAKNIGNNSLIKPPVKKGCSSCGKVTWKPNKKSM
ncbi:hypothetical protein [Fictibacillus phosphorivorans]|uniref:hypothetical protein n=1 Tax=Fictibacillus phosphorivorans TaxID=1221500 RepID=UPI00203C0CF6|nr:hypothetical protein [Fictibacillus phosphorivorans]MCM3719151.1 hypothetical protein [Fictibacillus phosphorivorans]MCM3776773.1 hypothetical protein [Fictibacillus phosphorivorans]